VPPCYLGPRDHQRHHRLNLTTTKAIHEPQLVCDPGEKPIGQQHMPNPSSWQGEERPAPFLVSSSHRRKKSIATATSHPFENVIIIKNSTDHFKLSKRFYLENVIFKLFKFSRINGLILSETLLENMHGLLMSGCPATARSPVHVESPASPKNLHLFLVNGLSFFFFLLFFVSYICRQTPVFRCK